MFQECLLYFRFFLLGNNNGKWQLSLRPSRFETASCVITSHGHRILVSGFDQNVALLG